ncbi:NAD-dependent epimerase/dehydratase family protein [Streptomyces sp. NPDC060053]|uniref:NAD-dependent epimerase/dehydratase family protein n=1 Tax=Streptomyces sp. NPDC060053 TaxID=3347047 RepID=UPI0036850D44
MTVLVIGGSGFLGGALVRQAVAAGRETAATFASRPGRAPDGVAWHLLDIRDPARVAAVIAGVAPSVVVNASSGGADWAVTADGAVRVALAATRGAEVASATRPEGASASTGFATAAGTARTGFLGVSRPSRPALTPGRCARTVRSDGALGRCARTVRSEARGESAVSPMACPTPLISSDEGAFVLRRGFPPVTGTPSIPRRVVLPSPGRADSCYGVRPGRRLPAHHRTAVTTRSFASSGAFGRPSEASERRMCRSHWCGSGSRACAAAGCAGGRGKKPVGMRHGPKTSEIKRNTRRPVTEKRKC